MIVSDKNNSILSEIGINLRKLLRREIFDPFFLADEVPEHNTKSVFGAKRVSFDALMKSYM